MRISLFFVIFILCVSVALSGCGANKEVSSRAAIEKSQSMTTVQQKVDYLTGQAKAFVNSKEYDQAINTAQYILSNLDVNSQEARSLIEKSKSEITAQAKAKMDEVKKQFGFGK